MKAKSNGVRNTDVLDNEFYLQLRGNWSQVKIAESGKFQWQRPDTEPNVKDDRRNSSQPNMFMNVDIGIVFKVRTLKALRKYIVKITRLVMHWITRPFS